MCTYILYKGSVDNEYYLVLLQILFLHLDYMLSYVNIKSNDQYICRKRNEEMSF